jgi:acetyl-CoA acetyltransferase
MTDDRIVVLDGARTPIGDFGGSLRDVPAHELGAVAARAALQRSGVAGADIDEVVMGCIGQVGGDAFNARRVALAAGLPPSVPAYTVNRLCGGAIALGHPVGATGAILSLRVARDLARRDLELGVVTMCIGGGQALAALFRRVG